MDLRQWLVDELDDTTARLKAQVLYLVPEARRRERPGGGNSLVWASYHAARHADLALSVLTAGPLLLPADENRDGGGLEEDEPPWSDDLSPSAVNDYLTEVVLAGRRYLGTLEAADVDRTPDTGTALTAAGIPADAFDWLYRMWIGKPAAFLIRWPLIGHLGNHVGEMIATRNRMGLSPF